VADQYLRVLGAWLHVRVSLHSCDLMLPAAPPRCAVMMSNRSDTELVSELAVHSGTFAQALHPDGMTIP
jgi:hypothetical protein